MSRAKLLLDTNVVVDFLNKREPYFEDARLIMIAGKVGDLDLWISASQMTDLVYIVSNGGKEQLMSDTLERLRALRSFVKVALVAEREVDRMLATTWSDPEDALLVDIAVSIGADMLVTRDDALLNSQQRVLTSDCAGFFAWFEEACGISYANMTV